MFLEKIKSRALQIFALLANLALVGGGALYLNNQYAEQKNNEALLAEQQSQELAKQNTLAAEQAQRLEQIVEKNRQEKTASIAGNPSQIIVKESKLITETLPGEVITENVPVKKALPAKTTKKS